MIWWRRWLGARAISAVIVDPSAASFIEALRRRSGFKVRQANNDVANGIRCVADYLLNGKIIIHRRCSATIREFGLYRWDEKQDNEQTRQRERSRDGRNTLFCHDGSTSGV